MAIRLVQLRHRDGERAVAAVQGDRLAVVPGFASIYDLALAAIARGQGIAESAAAAGVRFTIDYHAVYAGGDAWSLLPSFDHPREPARCRVTGTGLTHIASARNRQAMHASAKDTTAEPMTDSMRMFQMGVEGGRPRAGEIGAAPEWFFKGDGSVLRAHGQSLCVPAFAGDGGEEPEIAGVYLIGTDGRPWRVGLTIANEFSDHKTEKINYLYLAPSKLRQCAIGPELVVGGEFNDVRGRVTVERQGQVLWSQAIATGEANMCHHLANLEHHHFKYPQHRQPGDAHVHFFGADAFSFGAGVSLRDADVMVVEWDGFGRPLRNPLQIEPGPDTLMQVGIL